MRPPLGLLAGNAPGSPVRAERSCGASAVGRGAGAGSRALSRIPSPARPGGLGAAPEHCTSTGGVSYGTRAATGGRGPRALCAPVEAAPRTKSAR